MTFQVNGAGMFTFECMVYETTDSFCIYGTCLTLWHRVITSPAYIPEIFGNIYGDYCKLCSLMLSHNLCDNELLLTCMHYKSLLKKMLAVRRVIYIRRRPEQFCRLGSLATDRCTYDTCVVVDHQFPHTCRRDQGVRSLIFHQRFQ